MTKKKMMWEVRALGREFAPSLWQLFFKLKD